MLTDFSASEKDGVKFCMHFGLLSGQVFSHFRGQRSKLPGTKTWIHEARWLPGPNYVTYIEIVVLLYISFDWWMCAFVVLGFLFPYQAKRLAWGTSLKWPILCRVVHKPLTSNQYYVLVRICFEWGANDLHMAQLMPLPPYHLLRHYGHPAWQMRTLYFCPVVSSFFPRLIQPSQIGCLPYFHTWCGLSANLGCRSETCCKRLAGNTGCKKLPKIRHVGTIAQLCRAISSQLRHVLTIGNKTC